ncbi:unnamed protein product [Cylicostephanus goldi]|uniref:Phorbol-ester/DAG-type domain-containing protein n=1 Tax=Cylicostephanus goldi TaxID=71465 RepID=A0A3P6QV60_CYLGO|nr:unnamed protein product [Cylicostephanus goldi]
MNPRLAELGLRLTSVTDEENGREMIVLVTEDVLPKELRTITGFSEEELVLFSRYVQKMVECGGECDQSWALQEGSKLPNPMSMMKTQAFIDKLAKSGWIVEKDENIQLAARTIAELEPVLAWKYGCPNCALCQKVVVRKFAAVTCESCHVHLHRHCWNQLAAGCEADEISCPGASINGCTAKLSKTSIAENTV